MSLPKPVGEPTYLPYTFRCTLCERSGEYRDGNVFTADEVRLTWIDGEEVKTRTMLRAEHPLICGSCMAAEDAGRIACVDARGCAVVAVLIMR